MEFSSVFPFPRNQQFTTVWRSPEDKEFPIHTAASNMSQSRSLQITSLILQGKPVCKQQHKNKDWKKTRDLKLNKKKVKNNKQLSSLRCKVQIQCSNVSWLPVVCFYMSALLNASAPKTPNKENLHLKWIFETSIVQENILKWQLAVGFCLMPVMPVPL